MGNHSDTGELHRYDDMLYLPHHVSPVHPPMSEYNRAAQFSPFAALVGFDAELEEAGRRTDRKIELSESEKAILNERLRIIQAWIDRSPAKRNCSPSEADANSIAPAYEVSITHFIPDEQKEGGAYAVTSGFVKKVDLCNQVVILADETNIPINCMIHIHSEGFN